MFGVMERSSNRRFAATVNGRIHGELRQRLSSPPVENEIAGLLDRMDGVRRYSVILWELPKETPFERVNLAGLPVHFIQAAGSRDRMTVEVRLSASGADERFVIGKTPTSATEPSEIIEWESVKTPVYDVEVFTAAEAVPLFLSYWQTGRVPAGYQLRQLTYTNHKII
jgi:hypothetical protein